MITDEILDTQVQEVQLDITWLSPWASHLSLSKYTMLIVFESVDNRSIGTSNV